MSAASVSHCRTVTMSVSAAPARPSAVLDVAPRLGGFFGEVLRRRSVGTQTRSARRVDVLRAGRYPHGIGVFADMGGYAGADGLELAAHVALSSPCSVWQKDERRGAARCRPGVAGQVLAAEFDDVTGRDVGGGHHDRLHGLASVVVGDTDDRGVSDAVMLDQHAFRLGSVNVLATGDDHVLEPVLDVDVTVGV